MIIPRPLSYTVSTHRSSHLHRPSHLLCHRPAECTTQRDTGRTLRSRTRQLKSKWDRSSPDARLISTKGLRSSILPMDANSAGEFQRSSSRAFLKTSRVTTTSQSDVEAAIQRAQSVFVSGVWSKSTTFSRAKVLTSLARILEKRLPEMTTIESMQTGRTLREMRAQLGRLPEWMSAISSRNNMCTVDLASVTIMPLCCAPTKAM